MQKINNNNKKKGTGLQLKMMFLLGYNMKMFI